MNQPGPAENVAAPAENVPGPVENQSEPAENVPGPAENQSTPVETPSQRLFHIVHYMGSYALLFMIHLRAVGGGVPCPPTTYTLPPRIKKSIERCVASLMNNETIHFSAILLLTPLRYRLLDAHIRSTYSTYAEALDFTGWNYIRFCITWMVVAANFVFKGFPEAPYIVFHSIHSISIENDKFDDFRRFGCDV